MGGYGIRPYICIYMRYGGILFEKQKDPLLVKGRVQRKGSGVAVIAKYISCLDI